MCAARWQPDLLSIPFLPGPSELCYKHPATTFASIVPSEAPRTEGDFLRKDYSYLFERFYLFLEEQPPDQIGLVVFDELERSRCHILIDQMSLYFRTTAKGKLRARRIIPEPFFFHSELTSAIQIADLVAYITCWGVVIPKKRAERKELRPLAEIILDLRWQRSFGNPRWGFTAISDLRPRSERAQKKKGNVARATKPPP